MNSPPDPGSPISTDTDSGPEEVFQTQGPSGAPHFITTVARDITQSFISGGSKRRLPGSSNFGASSSSRDPKSRRRLDVGKSGGGAGGASLWEGQKESKREDKDVVDQHLVEFLRREIGDPFDDSAIQKHA
ncbi:hypothetical protein DXG03_001331 [Asterophora parasitica]|uniref:Uncharacterized protein n=1 Tax=Asterophora parasitica TaxID=117018 RepID=A0A9P7KAC7_9AGAR|nr:hypothetical protein DXG03_001331 [Asterophora parasitica]